MARSELEVAGGFFLVRVRDEDRRLPELPWGEAREWSRRLAALWGPVYAAFETEWQPGEGLLPVQAANERAVDTIIDLVLEYDTAGVLTRDDLEGMPAGRIRALYRSMYEEAHPFDGDLQTALMQMATLRVNQALANQSAGANSTNGSSPNTTSPRPTSSDVSPLDRSNSSGTADTDEDNASDAIDSARGTKRRATGSSRRTSSATSGKRRVA